MSHEHSQVRKLTKNWLDEKEEGAKSDLGHRGFMRVQRVKDAIYFGPRREIDELIRDNNRRGLTRWLAALKKSTDEEDLILINYGISSAGNLYYSNRATARSEVIREYCDSNDATVCLFDFSIPQQARINLRQMEFVDIQETDLPGKELLLGHRGKRLLLSWNFGCLVSDECTTIESAYDWLKPDEVKDAEAGGRQVQRHGDWFLIPVPEREEELGKFWERKKIYRNNHLMGYRLPIKGGKASNENWHIANRGCFLEGYHFVAGTLRHHDPRTKISAGEHSMFLLEVPHLAIRNKSLENFSRLSFLGRGNRRIKRD